MKIRIVYICCLILGLVQLTACQDDDDVNPGQNTLPPGNEYVKEGNYCLNVVYYATKGVDTVENWHQLYSSYVLQVQEEFKTQMTACGYPGKTFNLQVNKQNPSYVNIIRLEGQTDSVWKKESVVLMNEVDAYFEQYPEQKQSNFTVVFGSNIPVEPWTLLDKGRVKHSGLFCPYKVTSLERSAVMLLVQYFSRMFFLDYNTEPFSDIYYSLMNLTKGTINSGIESRLLKADAMWLNQNQVFNQETKAYFTESPEVKVTATELKYENDQIKVTCEFTSPQNVVGVIVYQDPWIYPDREDEIWDNNYTTRDAIPYGTDQVIKNGSAYQITVHIPWKDLPVTYQVPESGENYREAEIRFRFLMEDGSAVPLANKGDINSGYRYPYKIKNFMPDFQDKVNTDIEDEGEE